jgi:uncharacterized protein YjbI with pentapeptide repeats
MKLYFTSGLVLTEIVQESGSLLETVQAALDNQLDLTDLNLQFAELDGLNATNGCLRRAGIGQSSLVGADFRGADLRGTDFWGANLQGAD